MSVQDQLPSTIGMSDLMTLTQTLHADLLTAKASNDPAIVHASLIAAVEGLLTCVRALASELVKIEIEGVDDQLP